MTHATSLYRAVVLEIERARIAAGWPSWKLDEAAGGQEGFWQKALHPDTPSGRQAQWQTLQWYLDALLPDGFDVVIRPKKDGCADAPAHAGKIRFVRAQYHRRTQREIMSELGKKGGSKGGKSTAEKLGKRGRKKSARHAANARWIKERGKQIAEGLPNGRA